MNINLFEEVSDVHVVKENLKFIKPCYLNAICTSWFTVSWGFHLSWKKSFHLCCNFLWSRGKVAIVSNNAFFPLGKWVKIPTSYGVGVVVIFLFWTHVLYLMEKSIWWINVQVFVLVQSFTLPRNLAKSTTHFWSIWQKLHDMIGGTRKWLWLNQWLSVVVCQSE